MQFGKYLLLTVSVACSFLLPSLPASAQYREESGALEQIYEARVRSALNTIMRPNEYSVVISVDIDQDPKRLQAIEDDLENMSLPGVPGLAMSENMPLSNKLHELRNRVSVHLVLDDAISAEREKAARDLTNMKLHLDESNGDILQISRAGLIPKELPPPKADLLPELSWRMWALVVIVSLLAIGLALLLLNRRPKRQEDPQEKTPTPEKHEELPAMAAAAKEESESPETPESGTLIELYKRKEALASIASKQPEAAARGIESLFDSGRKVEVVRLMEALGWEQSKELFHRLNHRCWAKIGSELIAQPGPSKPEELLAAVTFCQQSLIAAFLESDELSKTGLFGFIPQLNNEEIQMAFDGLSAPEIATVCAALNKKDRAYVLEGLEEKQQETILISMTKINRVPSEEVARLRGVLRERVQQIKNEPGLIIDNLKNLKDLLSSLDVMNEYKFLEKLRKEDPKQFQNLRKSHLFFEDIAQLPADIINECLSSLDMETIARALYQGNEQLVNAVLESLPEKRAKMVEKELAYLQNLTQKDVLAARRRVAEAGRLFVSANGHQLPQLFAMKTEIRAAA